MNFGGTSPDSPGHRRTRFADLWRCGTVVAGLVVVTLAAYWPAGGNGFVNLDDDAYVQFQPMVNQGLRGAGVVWALTSSHSSNWHPLTTFSHMLDCQWFGLRPGPMHWENVVWHLLNTILVFLVWRGLTMTLWRAAFVAALFALTPLHVESVTWISERKDVLSTFFWLAGIGAYIRYTRVPSAPRYFMVVLSAVLALLSKPMAVTFPCTLLLIDFWPLGRARQQSWLTLVWEKVPLFALVAVHSAVTFFVQRSSGAAHYGQRFPLGERAGNALVSYFRYVAKAIWPETLSPLYMHLGYWPAWILASAVVALVALGVLIWRQRRQRPWLAFGVLWFVGTLMPVIGLVQVGAQSIADRYTYVPLLGIFTLAAWFAAEFVPPSRAARARAMALAAMLLSAAAMLTRLQIRAWRSSVALYEHSIATGEDNSSIRYLLGVSLKQAGRPPAEVAAQFERALAFEPDYVNALTQLAVLAMEAGRLDEAQRRLEQAIHDEPQNPGLHANLGNYFLHLKRPDLAAAKFEDSLRVDPSYIGANVELARIEMAGNRWDAARQHLETAARNAPWDPAVLNEVGAFYVRTGNPAAALPLFRRAVWIRPAFAPAAENLRAIERTLPSGSPHTN
jgi:protein O-mannosyl-transferase